MRDQTSGEFNLPPSPIHRCSWILLRSVGKGATFHILEPTDIGLCPLIKSKLLLLSETALVSCKRAPSLFEIVVPGGVVQSSPPFCKWNEDRFKDFIASE